MKLFSLPLICLIILPSLFAFQEHNQDLAYTHPAIVVKDGVSYISLKDVPAGKQIDSSEFWTTLLGTAPSSDPGDPPTTEPDTNNSDLGNLTPPEDNSSVSSRFLGISTRGPLSNDYKMYGGLTVLGTESKRVAFMAKGISMSAQGITDYVSNTKLEIFRKDWDEEAQRKKWKLIRTIENWGDVNSSESITNADGSTGVILPIGENEAGIVLDLIPANYTFNVSTTDENISQAIVEAYEINGDQESSRFLGISTRGPLSKDYKMYGGLTVLGTETKRVAFMAKGISMSAQGITDYVSDPKLEIFRKDWDEEAQRKKWKLIRTVDDWGDVNSTESITNAEGSTGVILPIGEKEAGIVLDLIPANYTFNVSTTDENISQAIVEAYELD